MLLGLLSLALAQSPPEDPPVADVVVVSEEPVYASVVGTTDDTLRLEADGSVTLLRTASFVIPEPPELTEEQLAAMAETDDADTDSDTDEPPAVVVTVHLPHPVDAVGSLSIASDTVGVRTASLRQVERALPDTRTAMAGIDADRERLRQAIAMGEDDLKRDAVVARPDLDLIDAQLAGTDVVVVSAADRAEEDLAYLRAQLHRATTAATLVLDGTPSSDLWIDIEVDPIDPGEHTITLTETIREARWASGYVFEPRPGALKSTWLAGVELPAEMALTDVAMVVDWDHGDVAVAGERHTFTAGTRRHLVTLAELPNRYRNLLHEDYVERRVDVLNPFEVPLPALPATMGGAAMQVPELEPDGTFRFRMGKAEGWKVKRRGNTVDVRTGLTERTPVWVPIDPTGCRVAATGQVEGPEEFDGHKGVTVWIGPRGSIAVMCE